MTLPTTLFRAEGDFESLRDAMVRAYTGLSFSVLANEDEQMARRIQQVIRDAGLHDVADSLAADMMRESGA